MTHRLCLRGSVPSKKNNLRRAAAGGMFTRRDSKAAINGLIGQALSLWHRPTIERAYVRCTFYVNTGRADGDNRLTTILDVLQAAKVIENDNGLRLPGASYRVVIGEGEERTEVLVRALPKVKTKKRKPVTARREG